METEQVITITMSKDEWDQDIRFYQRTTKQGRRRFLKGFDHEINNRLKKEIGLCCWLKSDQNWFRKSNSIRDTAPYWRGTYGCLNKKCKQKFICQVQNLEPDESTVSLEVRWQGHPNHSDTRQKKQCRGEARELMRLRAAADGASKLQASNIVENNFSNTSGI